MGGGSEFALVSNDCTDRVERLKLGDASNVRHSEQAYVLKSASSFVIAMKVYTTHTFSSLSLSERCGGGLCNSEYLGGTVDGP